MRITFAGTGDGRGVPAVGCKCKLCERARGEGGKNHRRRVSVIIRNGTETILFDTPASIGQMLNEKRIFHISAIFLSHKHFDHIAGITEFEYWPKKIPVYGNMSVLGNFEITDRLYEPRTIPKYPTFLESIIINSFHFIFCPSEKYETAAIMP